MPGKMWCDGPRQEAVFRACSHKPTSSSRASLPMARGLPVAAAGGASMGNGNGSSSNGSGGGAIHVVPAGSSHGSFTDLPFLINPWVSNQLRKLVSCSCDAHIAHNSASRCSILLQKIQLRHFKERRGDCRHAMICSPALAGVSFTGRSGRAVRQEEEGRAVRQEEEEGRSGRKRKQGGQAGRRRTM